MSEHPPYQATPSATLREQVMDRRIPKSEREWWASREIESLERRNSELTARIAELEKERDDALREREGAWNAHGNMFRKLAEETGDFRREIAGLKDALAEARKDSARIDAIIANKWTVTWNYLRDSFIIQSQNQICGNIGHSKPLRELLDAATPHPETKEGQL